jgi:hypothetical protein
MLLHFVVISIFDRNTGGARLGPKDLDLAHRAVSEQWRRMGMGSFGKARDPMWYLMRDDDFVGYVRVFREERPARYELLTLSEQDVSKNPWAYWRDGYPLALIEGSNCKDANQFVDYVAICRVRAFSDQAAAENGWRNWISGNLTAIEIYQDKKPRRGATDERATDITQRRRLTWKLDADISGFFEVRPRKEKRGVIVQSDGWKVTTGESSVDGPRPSEMLIRTYLLSGLAPPQETSILTIGCKLECEAFEDIPKFVSCRLNFFLRPFSVPRDTLFVMGCYTVDQSRGGEFDVVASPVDDDTSVFGKFGGRNDMRTCLDVLLAGNDLLFTISNETKSLVNFRVPNDEEFKRAYDEACSRLVATEVARKHEISLTEMVSTSKQASGAFTLDAATYSVAEMDHQKLPPWYGTIWLDGAEIWFTQPTKEFSVDERSCHIPAGATSFPRERIGREVLLNVLRKQRDLWTLGDEATIKARLIEHAQKFRD